MTSLGGTARGDRSQRRIDVLTAATQILDESGWAGLNMREVAARAGVSAGATYQWFSGKDEIYAELLTARFVAGTEGLRATPADMTLEELLFGTFRWVGKTWNDLGRWQLEFAEISRTRDDVAYVETLGEAHRTLVETGMAQLARLAAAEGHNLPNDRETADLIWGAAVGIATRAAVLEMPAEQLESLQRNAVRVLLTGLLETT